MPIYEYECEKCGHRFEKIQKFSDAPPDTCPKCGGALHKMQSAPAFQFKGTGWYVTDYPKSGASETKDTKDTKKASEASEASKSDAAQTEAAPSTPAKTETKTKSGD
jgi:putative FmdB family regulatory protein